MAKVSIRFEFLLQLREVFFYCPDVFCVISWNQNDKSGDERSLR